MAKPTVVATTEVKAQGAVVELSTDDGTTYNVIPGLESVPRVGSEGSFIEVQSIDETTKRFIAAMKSPPEWELPFRRIGNSTVQDALIAAANSEDPAVNTVKIRVTYQTGDIADIDIVFNGSYAEAAEQGDAVQMFAVKGQQTGAPVFSKVA